MTEYFRRAVLRFFTEKKLLSEQFVQNMLSWRHSGFSIDNSVRILDARSRENLAQYLARPPISLKKIHYEGFKPSDSPQAISQAQGFVRSTKRRGPCALSHPLQRVFQGKRAYVQGLRLPGRAYTAYTSQGSSADTALRIVLFPYQRCLAVHAPCCRTRSDRLENPARGTDWES